MKKPPLSIDKVCNINGFTLIELMVIIAIVAILTGIALPSFQTMIKNSRQSSNANEIHTSLTLSRSEAIKYGAFVTICSSSNLTSCSNSLDWSDGWIIFMDRDGDTNFEDDSDATVCEVGEDCLIMVSSALSETSSLSSTISTMTFDLNGVPITRGTLTASPVNCNGGDKNYIISVNSTGRANVEPNTC